MKTVNSKIQEVWVEYNKEFPPIQEIRAQIAPNTTIEHAALGEPSGLGEATVITSATIDSQEEYVRRQALHHDQCQKAEQESINEYINSCVVLVVADYDSAKIEKKLKKIQFISEPGRKLFLYDALSRDPLDWATLKKQRRSYLSGANVAMTFTNQPWRRGWRHARCRQEHLPDISADAGQPAQRGHYRVRGARHAHRQSDERDVAPGMEIVEGVGPQAPRPQNRQTHSEQARFAGTRVYERVLDDVPRSQRDMDLSAEPSRPHWPEKDEVPEGPREAR